jgi:hypothetical protein
MEGAEALKIHLEREGWNTYQRIWKDRVREKERCLEASAYIVGKPMEWFVFIKAKKVWWKLNSFSPGIPELKRTILKLEVTPNRNQQVWIISKPPSSYQREAKRGENSNSGLQGNSVLTDTFREITGEVLQTSIDVRRTEPSTLSELEGGGAPLFLTQHSEGKLAEIDLEIIKSIRRMESGDTYALRVIVDPGASMSTITPAELKKLQSAGVEVIINKSFQPYYVGGGGSAKSEGTVMLNILNGNRIIQHSFMITPSHLTVCLLGIDFVHKQGKCMINCEEGYVEYGGEGPKYPLQHPIKGPQEFTLVTTEPIFLEGNCQRIVLVKVQGWNRKHHRGLTGMVKPNSVIGLQKKIYTAWGIAKPRGGQLHINILTTNELPQLIPEGTPLAVLEKGIYTVTPFSHDDDIKSRREKKRRN